MPPTPAAVSRLPFISPARPSRNRMTRPCSPCAAMRIYNQLVGPTPMLPPIKPFRPLALFCSQPFLSLAFLFVCTGVYAQNTSHSSTDGLNPTVILVSVDGFRADYMGRVHPPTWA